MNQTAEHMTMAGPLPDQMELNSPEQRGHLQETDDVVTQFAELVDGGMRTEFPFVPNPDGTELHGRDGRGMRAVGEKFLKIAKKSADRNPNLKWNLRRTEHESEEIDEVIDMANGKGPNTRVVTSDFPLVLRGARKDFGGFNVTRMQTMMRVYLRQPDGTILMITQTLDASNRRALEAIHNYFGKKPRPGELLGQRIGVDLSAEEQTTIVTRLTGIYDRSMTEQYGGKWYAGRRPADYRNTYDFVRQQPDLIEACIRLKLNNQLTTERLYNMAATMQERFKQQRSGKVVSIIPHLKTVNTVMLNQEMYMAGQRARARGDEFSACGDTLTADDTDSSTEAQLKKAGYGSGLVSSSEWHGGTKHYNTKCNSCEEVKSEVGACLICEDCVSKPINQKIAYLEERRQARRHEKEVVEQAAADKARKAGELATTLVFERQRRQRKQQAATREIGISNIVQLRQELQQKAA